MRCLPWLLASATALLPAPSSGQWQSVPSGTTAEFRSLHARDARVVWAGGRGGVVARSVDGGRSFSVDTIRSATNLFMVGIHGSDGNTAHVLGTSFDGGLARIYRTLDGGRTWEERYADTRPDVFMDALGCWDVNHCVAFGDPVEGTFVVARTTDAGESWSRLPAERLPAPLAGEAGFAASGRALVTGPEGLAWFGTGGGAHARVYRTDDHGATWSVHDTPLPGGPTAGIFALAFREDGLHGLAVGGDYQLRAEAHPTVIATSDGGRTWRLVETAVQPPGVRYGVAAGSWNDAPAWVATGPSGVGYSTDGVSWRTVSDTGFNTVFYAGGVGFYAGPDGALAKHGGVGLDTTRW